MDAGQLVFMYSRLVLGALAAFLAITLWSKTRDTAWMLIVIGTVAAYVETVYPVFEMTGVSAGNTVYIGSVPLAAILLPAVRTAFFIAAFLVMIKRRYGRL